MACAVLRVNAEHAQPWGKKRFYWSHPADWDHSATGLL